MNEKRRKFLQFSVTGLLAVLIAGSTEFLVSCGKMVMTWISIGLSLIGTLLPTVPGIVAGFASLVGKTLTAAQQAAIVAFFQKVTDLLTQIQTAIQTYEANPGTNTITDIKQLLTTLESVLNINTLLADIGIKDPATVSKLTSIVAVILGLATDILSILPAVTVLADGSKQMKTASQDKLKAMQKQLQPAAFANRLNQAIWVKTGSATVDTVFESIKATPVTVAAK